MSPTINKSITLVNSKLYKVKLGNYKVRKMLKTINSKYIVIIDKSFYLITSKCKINGLYDCSLRTDK